MECDDLRFLWKAFVPVICTAMISGAAIYWQAHKKADERKHVENAKACLIRAEHGDAISQYDLALMYHQGKGIQQDYNEALRWYRKSADQGNEKAQYGLGYMYCEGEGTPQNYSEALRWYRKAADQGDARALYSFGTMYYYGRGVPADSAEAARWYRKAADQGLARAQYDLGYLYYFGQGVPQDRTEANRWFHKAADQGDEYARQTLGEGLTTWRTLILLVQFIAGILLTAGLLIPRKVSWSIQTNRATIAGGLCFLSAGLRWYGYTHSKIYWMFFGFNALLLFSWMLNVVLVVLLIYILTDGWRRLTLPPQNVSLSSLV